MALREDYYTPCIDELMRKISVVEDIQEELNKVRKNTGVENSQMEEDIKDEIKRLDKLLEDVRDMLYDEKRKLADKVSDI